MTHACLCAPPHSSTPPPPLPPGTVDIGHSGSPRGANHPHDRRGLGTSRSRERERSRLKETERERRAARGTSASTAGFARPACHDLCPDACPSPPRCGCKPARASPRSAAQHLFAGPRDARATGSSPSRLGRPDYKVAGRMPGPTGWSSGRCEPRRPSRAVRARQARPYSRAAALPPAGSKE